MTLNLKADKTFFQFDKFGMLIVPSDQSWEKRSWWKKLWDKILKREWIPTWKNESWKDSLGRTVFAWIAYGRPKELISSLDSCLQYNFQKKKWYLKRHPDYDELASRDHWSYFIIYRTFYFKDLEDFQSFAKDIPRMRGMNFWRKALMGNKMAEWWYYTLYIPGVRIGNMWLKFCRWVGEIQPERDNNWWIDIYDLHHNFDASKPAYIYNWESVLHERIRWQKLWAWIIFQTIPAYPFHNKGWQLYVMPESKRKERLKRILLKRVGESNLLLRLLYGDTTVTQKEIDNYPHMTGFRPGVYLDETCRRTIRELTAEEAEFNCYEKDLIIWLFNKQKNG